MIGHTTSTMLPLLAVGLFVAAGQAQLQQTYCSNQNTGSGNQQSSSLWQSNGLCLDTCKQNYAFAVVQYQSCWCSDYVPADQLDTSDCNVGCPGFPDEKCGNADQGLYGYIALSKAPSGTAGASPTQTRRTQTSFGPSRGPGRSPSPTSTEEPTTFSSSAAPPTTEASLSPTTSEPPYSPPTVTTTSTSSQEPSDSLTAVVTPAPSSSTSTSTSTTSSETETPTPVTNTQVVTVSGAIVTQTVTSTPRPRPTSDATAEQPTQSKTSTGVVVGAVVGSVAGVGFLFLALFILWRRRRSGSSVASSHRSSKIARNASVLSKAGLLSSSQPQDPEKSMEEPRYGSQRHSALYDPPESPISAPGGVYESGHPSRRNSRPLVYDQRLNPAALMENWQLNGSRTSVGTMQDQRDYSRPLGITNPDSD